MVASQSIFCGEGVELLPIVTLNTARCRKPYRAILIGIDVLDPIMCQSVFCGEGDKLLPIVARDPTAFRPKPQTPIGGVIDRREPADREPGKQGLAEKIHALAAKMNPSVLEILVHRAIIDMPVGIEIGITHAVGGPGRVNASVFEIIGRDFGRSASHDASKLRCKMVN